MKFRQQQQQQPQNSQRLLLHHTPSPGPGRRTDPVKHTELTFRFGPFFTPTTTNNDGRVIKMDVLPVGTISLFLSGGCPRWFGCFPEIHRRSLGGLSSCVLLLFRPEEPPCLEKSSSLDVPSVPCDTVVPKPARPVPDLTCGGLRTRACPTHLNATRCCVHVLLGQPQFFFLFCEKLENTIRAVISRG